MRRTLATASRTILPRALGALALSTLVSSIAGCGGGGKDAPWTFSHDSYFVVTGSHAGFTCDQCHDPTAPSFSLALGGVDCLGCHAQATVSPLHAGITGFAWANASCIGCHKDGSSGLPPNHDAELFPVTGTKHATVACSQCHGPTRAVADLQCAPCHAQAAMASAHAAIPATTTGRLSGTSQASYQWASPYCVRCHADGTVDRIASHPAVQNGLSGGGHAPFCLTCHGTMRASGKTWGADFTTYSCLACHTNNSGGGGG